MTEEQYQQARKTMSSATRLRHKISTCKKDMSKYSGYEMSAKERMKEGQVDGAQKAQLKIIERLKELRQNFASLKFPE